jgi:hypothetical protein
LRVDYGEAIIPYLDTTGKKYPYKLKHGRNKLPPYYLGICKHPKCKEKAVFKCYFHEDKKSIPVKCGTRYLSC